MLKQLVKTTLLLIIPLLFVWQQVAYGESVPTAFTVTAKTPAANAVGQSLGFTNVTLTLSDVLDPTTWTYTTLVIRSNYRGKLPYTGSVSNNLMFIDLPDLLAGEQIQVVATSGLKSTGGDALTPIQWGFRAGNQSLTDRCVTYLDSGSADDAIYGRSNGDAAWADYDKDNDLDLIITGGDSFGAVVELYRNDNGTLVDSGSADNAIAPIASGSIDWGDYDNDGDVDLLLSGNNTNFNTNANTTLYYNDNGTFVYEPASIQLPDVRLSDAAFVDFNNSGNLDVAILGLRHDGTQIGQMFRHTGTSYVFHTSLVARSLVSIDWGDYDLDGDADMLVAGVHQFGNPILARADVVRYDPDAFYPFAVTQTLPAVYGGEVAWGDIDNDGDLDAVVTGESSVLQLPTTALYRNDNGSFVDSGNTLLQLHSSTVDWGDYDNDGDLDLLLMGGDADGNLHAKLYINDGGTFSDSGIALTGYVDGKAQFVDYDGDNDLDIFLTGKPLLGVNQAKLYTNVDCPVAGPGNVTTDIALWLKPDIGVVNRSGVVEMWRDQSSNENHVVQATADNRPSYQAQVANLNNQPAVRLDGTDDFLNIPADVIDGTSDFTIFAVLDWHGGSHWQRLWDFGDGTSNRYGFLTPFNGTTNLPRYGTKVNASENNLDWGKSLPSGSSQLIALRYDSDGTAQGYLQGLASGGETFALNSPVAIGNIVHHYIGKSIFAGDPYLDADLAEFVIYRAELSDVEFAQVALHLGHKYNLSLEGSGFLQSATHNNDVDGISQRAGITTSRDNGLLVIENTGFLQEADDLISLGHDGNTGASSADLPATIVQRLNRTWDCAVNDAGSNGGTVNLVFELPIELEHSTDETRYALLHRAGATGDFTIRVDGASRAFTIVGGNGSIRQFVAFDNVAVSGLCSEITLGSRVAFTTTPTAVGMAHGVADRPMAVHYLAIALVALSGATLFVRRQRQVVRSV